MILIFVVSSLIFFSQGIISEYLARLINDIKKYAFGLEVKTVGYQDKIFIKIDTDTADVKTILIAKVLYPSKAE